MMRVGRGEGVERCRNSKKMLAAKKDAGPCPGSNSSERCVTGEGCSAEDSSASCWPSRRPGPESDYAHPAPRPCRSFGG